MVVLLRTIRPGRRARAKVIALGAAVLLSCGAGSAGLIWCMFHVNCMEGLARWID